MENNNVWEVFLPFQTAHYAQTFLHRCYLKHDVEDALAQSYKNGYPLCYYFEHGKRFYQQADIAPAEIKPVLLFYGLVQLLKGCLLIKDTNYPSNADVLSHGVSTRKRKKVDYTFIHDTVKIQKHGLFSHAVQQLFSIQAMPSEKWTMDALLKQIPEMDTLIYRLTEKTSVLPVEIEAGNLRVPISILDDWKVSQKRFSHLLGFNTGLEHTDDYLIIKKGEKHLGIPSLLHDENGGIYLPRKRDHVPKYPEIFTHYLLLYNLSMICRYETEWWSDLHGQRSSNDLPVVNHFLSITASKAPKLVADLVKTYEPSF